jgi:hypothetical protein
MVNCVQVPFISRELNGVRRSTQPRPESNPQLTLQILTEGHLIG